MRVDGWGQMLSRPTRRSGYPHRIGLSAVALATLLMLVACSSPTDSSEYTDLSAERDELVEQVADAQSDLDSLLAEEGASSVAEVEALAVELGDAETQLSEQQSRLSAEVVELEGTVIGLAEEGQALEAVVDSASSDLRDLRSLNGRLESGDF